MKAFSIVNKGLEKIAGKEVSEILSSDVDIGNGVVSFDVDAQKIVNYVFRAQCVRRVLIDFGSVKDLGDFKFKDFDFPLDLKYTIKVEGVKGQDNRQKIAKVVGAKFAEGKEIKFDYKNPDVVVIIYFNGEEYYVGLDVMGIELDQRHYRVFPHSASFKGDFSYYFARKAGFEKGKTLLMSFCKDGAIPIEAALFDSDGIVQDVDETYTFEKLDLFKGCTKPVAGEGKGTIHSVDETMQNTNAARKNAKLANVSVDVKKYGLDDLDVKFDEGSIDVLIFHVTSKDEDRINEMYYQASYILKSQGRLMFIGRESWDVSISDKFNFVEKEDLAKGDSIHRIWILEKK
ncbi:hypothetical protein HOD05_00040 [Candidatus Woesearchaeota archaeon]|jgi:23S rRNA G2445 N2-methylase RlmL|nr:hypothetical protein [Candidatus Woesearchaeota archaeon]MBT4150802.1 hypothetical protein [Candidatus Woesearchaeota archaeon]MBT4246907.1 hypothetical protein [Candidatus Woesearchaeota archaeon]MBT4433592.1 hypothetical protein [Candidatus Woesearchaeota archaeon]MBT7332317.1 hypothetical protein [Candidatus Woesearchaeota archaeon]